MIEALAGGERVDLLVDDARTEDRVRSMLSAKNVAFHRIESADVWMRDYGPIFVRKGGKGRGVAATKWEFNAWGGKYDDLLPDNETGLEVARSTGLTHLRAGGRPRGGLDRRQRKGIAPHHRAVPPQQEPQPQAGQGPAGAAATRLPGRGRRGLAGRGGRGRRHRRPRGRHREVRQRGHGGLYDRAGRWGRELRGAEARPAPCSPRTRTGRGGGWRWSP